jgi:hypothetical protein
MDTMTREFTEAVLQGEGRFYFAKDSTLTAEMAQRFLGPDTISEFQNLKARCDPDGLLESDLYRRCFQAPI